ncbi:MAG: formyltetrahydrofolate deformylase [Candidatus Margulisiibacteriota bacterium]|jgi:formyltetrahydrofolate deformylase
MQTAILILECNDQKGIVSKISNFIFCNNANITALDQYTTDPENGHFFMRVEFYFNKADLSLAQFKTKFSYIAEDLKASWAIYEKYRKLNMGILVSKPDHCLADLLYLNKTEELKVNIPFVVSNHVNNAALVESFGIPFYCFDSLSKQDFEQSVLALSKENEVNFLVLARFMQVLSESFLVGFNHDIINIHHSFLPSFKGDNPYQKAYDHGVKIIGATAHYVTKELDEGPIIEQLVTKVSHKDTVNDLISKGKNLEKIALAEAIKMYLEYRIVRYKNKTIVFN